MLYYLIGRTTVNSGTCTITLLRNGYTALQAALKRHFCSLSPTRLLRPPIKATELANEAAVASQEIATSVPCYYFHPPFPSTVVFKTR